MSEMNSRLGEQKSDGAFYLARTRVGSFLGDEFITGIKAIAQS